MSKNILICCDGTGNEYGDSLTNVFKLYSFSEKRTAKQIAFYDPGIGTFSAPGALTKPAKVMTKVLGQAFGLGLTKNIADAYKYIMYNYEEGDQVYIFGFSRGAYTARAVAAFLYKCGLLYPYNDNLLNYAMKIFKYDMRRKIYKGFKKEFTRECPVHFLGVWDTVKSVGWIYDPLTLQYTANNPIVKTARHAISIDERRCQFRQNHIGNKYKKDIKEIWFTGVHSDVGGSYPEKECGLSQIALKWMTDEARKSGLLINEERYAQIMPENAADQMTMDSDEVDAFDKYHAPMDYNGPIHKSLNGVWWAAEYSPNMYKDPDDHWKRKLKIPRGERRRMPEGAVLHPTVKQRMEEDPNYMPPNLPKVYTFGS